MIIKNKFSNPSAEQWNEKEAENLSAIDDALKAGRIDKYAHHHLRNLYTDGMNNFRVLFQMLGKLLGAPKTPVFSYNAAAGVSDENPEKISNINPGGNYLVHHRLNIDPVRNQFFNSDGGHNIQLSVSSIISVLVASQKRVARAIEKITGKYRTAFAEKVLDASGQVLSKYASESFVADVMNKIKRKFDRKYISNASEEVLSIIGSGFERISVDLVRELDKIKPPHEMLNDVYRIKCLFDLIPQARAFIQEVKKSIPDRIIEIRDKFFDMDNPRAYRDSRIILDIGDNGNVIPLEIICQVRTFFEFERESHKSYEVMRAEGAYPDDIRAYNLNMHLAGIKSYNSKICGFLNALFDRVGWNILYRDDAFGHSTLFDGFPRIGYLMYPQKVIDSIMGKIENSVHNEVFKLENTPVKLNLADEISVFRYLTAFIMTTAIPYSNKFEKVKGTGIESRLFNFVMAELYRFHKNKAPFDINNNRSSYEENVYNVYVFDNWPIADELRR